jgi:methylenetetrahydrofolate reductase (NADPH)
MPNLAMAVMIEQARRLIAYGAPGLHVYTMNRWTLPLALARQLGHQLAPLLLASGPSIEVD